MTIGDLVATMRLNVTPFKAGVTQSQGLLSKMGGSMTSLIAKGAALGAGFMGVSAVLSGAKWGLQLAAEAEQAEVAFTTLLGSSEAAQQMLKGLTQFAADTPFDMPELKTAARQLAAFGVEGGQIVPQLKMIGDIAAGTGQPIAELAEIYGKAKVQGRLFGEDINQLTGRGIPIIGALAAQFGVAESEVKKMVEQGRIGFPELQRAFMSMTSEGGKFEGMMEAQSKTLAGVWGAFTDNASMIVSDFFSWLAKTWNFTGLVTVATDWMATTVEIVKWGIENWALLWEIAYTSAALQMVRLGAEVTHFFTGVIPSLFDWFGQNWRDIWFTAMDTTLTMMINLGKNIRSIFTALWDFIASGGTRPLQLSWVPLTDGLRNTIRSMPEIPAREMGAVEQALQGQLAGLTDTAANSLADFTSQTTEGALSAVALADPTGGLAAKNAAGTSKSSGPATAIAGSAEAYKLINTAISGKQSAQENYAKKAAERQLNEAKKQTALLTTIASGVTDVKTEEVDI